MAVVGVRAGSQAGMVQLHTGEHVSESEYIRVYTILKRVNADVRQHVAVYLSGKSVSPKMWTALSGIGLVGQQNQPEVQEIMKAVVAFNRDNTIRIIEGKMQEPLRSRTPSPIKHMP